MAITWTAVEAPLFCLGDVVRGTWPMAARWHRPIVLSWVMNNYWPTNVLPVQPGPARFRYAFRVDETWDPASAARFGREVRVPPAVAEITELDRGGQPAQTSPRAARTLLELDCDEHVVASLFPARHRAGLLVRLLETAGIPGAARLTNPYGTSGRVLRCHADERPLAVVDGDRDGHVVLPVGPFGAASFLVTPDEDVAVTSRRAGDTEGS